MKADKAAADSATAPACRITVALIPEAAAGLEASRERSGLSKTDIVNRAITLHEFITAGIASGLDLILRDPSSGETQLVRLI